MTMPSDTWHLPGATVNNYYGSGPAAATSASAPQHSNNYIGGAGGEPILKHKANGVHWGLSWSRAKGVAVAWVLTVALVVTIPVGLYLLTHANKFGDCGWSCFANYVGERDVQKTRINADRQVGLAQADAGTAVNKAIAEERTRQLASVQADNAQLAARLADVQKWTQSGLERMSDTLAKLAAKQPAVVSNNTTTERTNNSSQSVAPSANTTRSIWDYKYTPPPEPAPSPPPRQWSYNVTPSPYPAETPQPAPTYRPAPQPAPQTVYVLPRPAYVPPPQMVYVLPAPKCGWDHHHHWRCV